MHCKGYVITKEIPDNNLLNKILEPYREDDENDNGFGWDWWQIGGRYSGKLKINFNPDENEDNWYLFKDRNHKYFIIDGLDEIKEKVKYYEELDWLKYMGLRETVLYVDGGYFKDLINFNIEDCYVIFDEDGYFKIRESWNGEDFIENNNFDNEVKQLDLKDKFITIIDFHY